MRERKFESKEDYLETILILSNRKNDVRSIDIADELKFSKPSVSIAMKNLREEGCITVDKNGYITLTKKGREIAERVYERHLVFTEWLTSIGVPPEIACEDACHIEHDVSVESFEAIKKYLERHRTNGEGNT